MHDDVCIYDIKRIIGNKIYKLQQELCISVASKHIKINQARTLACFQQQKIHPWRLNSKLFKISYLNR